MVDGRVAMTVELGPGEPSAKLSKTTEDQLTI
jgi:hypothetical protein